ncbi:pimeloyl-ACP methyl ester carboxylesterase [Gillisia mitskevichiae]|uniref:Pimeloyl-ACP methyl ester carboxylesterase n=2 Tax=Gillisia mitskevichiae TaxID=270921 RepID=A0A495PXG4_9FLAO|nr:pimeloyl-ACP methyl ester carboxylesterase [Gillisia mitskevichiae]
MMQMYKNTKLFYRSIGTGNPLLLLHGFLESSSIWDPFVEELSKRRQVITIDLPGHGKSGSLEEVHSMDLMADAVFNVLQQLKTEQVTIIGHSMGGYVSLAFCKKFPILTKGLVLLNSTPEPDNEDRKKNRDRAIKIIKNNKESYVSMAISNLLSEKNRTCFPKELEKLKNEALNFSEDGIIAALKGMKIRTDLTSTLTLYNGPKHIIAGMSDPILKFSDIQTIAEATNSSFLSLDGGHLSFIENKRELIELMHFID